MERRLLVHRPKEVLMAKQNKVRRLESPPTTKARGRTAKTTAPEPSTPTPTEGKVQQERLTEANRPIGAGSGKLRGDRRDTSRMYTGNRKHAARGNNPRADVSTRKR
jgi:hypothetical protein